MKKVLMLLVGLVLCGAWKVANPTTQEILVDKLPTGISVDGAYVDKPTLRQCQKAGWRYVISEDTLTNGWTIDSQNVVDLGDSTNCQLTVKTSHDPIAQVVADAIAASNAAVIWHGQQMSDLSNTVDRVLTGTNAADALTYSYGWWIMQCMVKSGVTNNLANAKAAIINTARQKIQ